MNTVSMKFDGSVLKRGFWLYVWEIRSDSSRHLYVGRTGDSSSPNAVSPFRRIGQHLDLKTHAKGNALARQLQNVCVDPHTCQFEMTALGPFFPEQEEFMAHKKYRDILAALEFALAMWLRKRGYGVIGTHGSKQSLDPELWETVQASLAAKYPDLSGSCS